MPERRLLGSLLLALTLCSAAAKPNKNGAKRGADCPDVCASCLDDGSCKSCASGAMRVGKPSLSGAVTCVKCTDPLCEECGPTPDKCQSCVPYWSFAQPNYTDDMPDWPVYQGADGRCRTCTNNPLSSGCLECDRSGSCTSCPYGTGVIGGVCKQCTDPLCKECGPTPDKCKSCFRFWSYAQPNYTNGMPDWPVYQGTDGRCRKCTNNPSSSGCYECDRSGRCLNCGYTNTGAHTVLAGGICKQCKGNRDCVGCNPNTLACTKCLGGTGLDAQRNCRPCANGLDENGKPACYDCNDDYRVCKECDLGLYLDPRGRCSKVRTEHCATGDRNGVCTKCKQSYALTPQRTACIPCASDCLECVFVSPGRTRCTECYTLTLINGECRRCDDPRCADCSADFRLCKACRNKAHVVNSATGRCQDPSWPAPCPQQAGGPGRRGGCAAPPRPNPKTAQSGRRLHAAGNGVVPQPAIYNGVNATRGRFPYMVSLRMQEGAGHGCGGALVHERVVLTAAHCILDDLDWKPESSVFTEARIGGYERNGGSYEARKVKWAVVHPGLDNFGRYNDFALLLLDRPSTTRPLLRLPPAVPRPAAAAGTPLTAIGWGEARDDWAPFNPEVLQQATIDMMALKACARYFPDEKWDAQFCAGPPAKRTDTCQGDSGGPLLWKSPLGARGDVVVGVVSWGKGCAEATPGVYADVASASQWIKNTIQWLVLEDAAGRIPGSATKQV